MPGIARSTSPVSIWPKVLISLFVAVLNGSRPVLPLRARAELVAAFRGVRSVIPVENDLDAVIAAVRPDEILNRTADHETQFRRLIEHVHQRRSR